MGIAYQLADGRYRIECPVVVNRRDGSVLVRVPAGVFEMGEGRGGDEPKHRVELGEYWIGVYAVTNRQWRRFVRETGRKAESDSEDKDGKLDHPKVNVTWEDARAYCEWAGGDLPTEAQWEKAARGPLGLTYPWGSEWDEKKCRNDMNKGSGVPIGVGVGIGIGIDPTQALRPRYRPRGPNRVTSRIAGAHGSSDDGIVHS